VEYLQSQESVANAAGDGLVVLDITGLLFEDVALVDRLFILSGFLSFCINPPWQEDDLSLSPLATSSAISRATTLLEDEGLFVEVFQSLDPNSLCSKSFDTLNNVSIDRGCLECAGFDCSPIFKLAA
jgi:hypothetical protein